MELDTNLLRRGYDLKQHSIQIYQMILLDTKAKWIPLYVVSVLDRKFAILKEQIKEDGGISSKEHTPGGGITHNNAYENLARYRNDVV